MATKSILNFFKPKEKNLLLDSDIVDKRTAEICNAQLEEVYVTSPNSEKKRGRYNILSPADKAEVGLYASQHSTPKTIEHFKDKFDLKATSVRNFKTKYLQEISRKRKLFDDNNDSGKPEVLELQPLKRGRPLLLGAELDAKVQLLINELRSKGGNINTRIVKALAKGVVLSKDRTLLPENGGGIDITRDWALSLMKRMNLVKRRGNSTAKPEIKDFDVKKAKFLKDIKTEVLKHDIPPQLIINWDHTGIHLVPVSRWTMAEKGSDKVEIIGLDDKREITGVMAGSLSGDILPPQVIYQGKTDQCHAKFNFPSDWHITHTENHWANTSTSYQYIDNIITPYVLDVKDKLDLPFAQKSLILLDFFSAQLGEDFRNYMLSKNLVYVYVPANCTSKLQPMDLSVQKCVKDRMREAFEDHYAEKVANSLRDNSEINIDLTMSTLKPLSAKWLVSAMDYLKCNPKIVFNGFHNAGIAENLGFDFDPENV